jgi:hypothetical protein
MTFNPEAPPALLLEGAPLADRQSRIRGDRSMRHADRDAELREGTPA